MGAKEGGVAAFELPRVTSGRPFRSPRGDCELSLVSSPFSPAVPSVTIVDRDGVGWFPSVCLDQGLRLSLQEARSDRGRPCFNATWRNWFWFRNGTVVVFQRDIKSLT